MLYMPIAANTMMMPANFAHNPAPSQLSSTNDLSKTQTQRSLKSFRSISFRSNKSTTSVSSSLSQRSINAIKAPGRWARSSLKSKKSRQSLQNRRNSIDSLSEEDETANQRAKDTERSALFNMFSMGGETWSLDGIDADLAARDAQRARNGSGKKTERYRTVTSHEEAWRAFVMV